MLWNVIKVILLWSRKQLFYVEINIFLIITFTIKPIEIAIFFFLQFFFPYIPNIIKIKAVIPVIDVSLPLCSVRNNNYYLFIQLLTILLILCLLHLWALFFFFFLFRKNIYIKCWSRLYLIACWIELDIWLVKEDFFNKFKWILNTKLSVFGIFLI